MVQVHSFEYLPVCCVGPGFELSRDVSKGHERIKVISKRAPDQLLSTAVIIELPSYACECGGQSRYCRPMVADPAVEL